MGQRGYTVAFMLVLLAACAGAFFGGRYMFSRITGAGARPTWTPPAATTEEPQLAEIADGPTPAAAALAAAAPAAAEPAASVQPQAGGAALAQASRTPAAPRLVLTPFTPPSPTFEPSSTPEPATPTPAVTDTVEPSPTPTSAFPFGLAAAVRHTMGDCNNLIVGQVTDPNGTPLPDIRLRITDEFASVNDIKATKSGASELGRYDFPLFGVGRRYFVTVVDANGTPMSERVEVEHGVGANAKATCHWVDWMQK